MSRAAGTLVTTYNATYAPPSCLPGYGGHVPTVNNQYGETYGHATEKYFHDYRNEVLNSSKSLYSRGGYFPTTYTNNPDLVINNRKLSRDRYLFNPKYQLNNTDFDRTTEINRFYQTSQRHRDYYKDRSGESHPVDDFILPVKNDSMYQSFLPYYSTLLRHKSDINIPYSRNFLPPKGEKTFNEYKLFNNSKTAHHVQRPTTGY